MLDGYTVAYPYCSAIYACTHACEQLFEVHEQWKKSYVEVDDIAVVVISVFMFLQISSTVRGQTPIAGQLMVFSLFLFIIFLKLLQ